LLHYLSATERSLLQKLGASQPQKSSYATPLYSYVILAIFQHGVRPSLPGRPKSLIKYHVNSLHRFSA